MASAYPTVISLKRTINRLKDHLSLSLQKMTKSAYEELEFLSDSIVSLDDDRNISINKSVMNAMDAKLREAVWKLEDVFESHVLHHSLPASQITPVDENDVEQELKSFFKKVQELKEEYIVKMLNNSLLEEEEEENMLNNSLLQEEEEEEEEEEESTTVGLSDQLEKIIDDLVYAEFDELRIVSLVGMAGIGKTKLATEIYQHPVIAQNFDFTAWVTVGPKQDQIESVLGNIVTQIEGRPRHSLSKHLENDVVTLSKLLETDLRGWRYLIVLDDIWSPDVCEALQKSFPYDGEGGRLLVTTRLEGVAEELDSSIHQMQFLSIEDSWNLLWRNVFDGSNSFPPRLEEAGRKIAENCEGLPLLILTVAYILRGLEKTEEYWKKVADNKTTTFTDAYDLILEVLYTSYEYLPQFLKPCFLYMGVFPQSCVIRVSKLIHLLVVEDFLELYQEQFQSLEDVAAECVKELVSHSLAIVCEHSSSFRIKSTKLHSAYWHLCVKEARKNKFFHALNKLTDCFSIESQRRFSVQNNVLLGIKEVHDSMAAASTARSILCTGKDHEYPVPICLNLMLLKVLDAVAIRFYEFPTEVVTLLRLKYLALTHHGELPSSISNLQQLQCLTLRHHHNIKYVREYSTYLPKEVWDIQQLRHLRIMGSNLPDPSSRVKLRYLLTLDVNAHSCTNDVLRSLPNLRGLGIKIELRPDIDETLNCFEHIRVVKRLKSLKCVVVNPRQVVAPPHHLSNLPLGLEKLSLNGLGYPWKYMRIIGSLPYLKVLKLRCCAFQGAEWEVKGKEFPRLEFLLLEDIDVVQWRISQEKCFSNLRRLIIRHCYRLKRIPWQIGVTYLETMEVVDCSKSVVASALQIKEENATSTLQRRQENASYVPLQLVINSSWNLL